MNSQQRLFMNNLCFALEAEYLRQLITLYDAVNSSGEKPESRILSIDAQKWQIPSKLLLNRDPRSLLLRTASPNYGDFKRILQHLLRKQASNIWQQRQFSKRRQRRETILPRFLHPSRIRLPGNR